MSSFTIHNYPSQKGKIAIVTGANTGIGLETARALAQKEATVVLACRNKQKAEAAKADILKSTPNASLSIILLDLNSFDSVKQFANEFQKTYSRLDFLIENAGIMVPPFQKTKDGLESQMGVNYFAHFLLTAELFPLIRNTSGARIITLSSIAHKNGKIEFDNLNAEKSYSKWKAYGQSKLACLMFAFELDRRLRRSGLDVLALSAHPGVSMTELSRHINKFLVFLFTPIFSFLSQKPQYAAHPSLLAALDENANGGDFYGPTGFNEMKGSPGKVKAESHALDEAVSAKLWEETEKIVGRKFTIE